MCVMPKTTRFIAGCMTGTSLDGLDIAIIRVEGCGHEMTATLIEQGSFDLGTLAGSLRRLADDQPVKPSEILRIAREFGTFHATALGAMKHAADLDAVIVHGQTIRHIPAEHLSWQLIDPWPIARKLDVPVCYDLRQADLIAGGNGAPITPLADWVLYRDDAMPRWIVNLGGICNITYLPSGDTQQPLHHIRGMDIGPCNLLLDGLVQQLYPGVTFDKDGVLALQGKCGIDLLPHIRKAPFFQRPLPRTTGREDFSATWVASILDAVHGDKHDLLYAAVDAMARQLADEVNASPRAQVILAGGSSCHPLLVDRIRHHVCHDVLLSDDLGIPVCMREAMGMAVLGALSMDHVPITLPQITGSVSPCVAGAWIGNVQ